jgi:hypothetical protein
LAPDQTLLLTMGNASSRDSAVLAVAGRYPNAILFRAVAVGRTTVTGFDTTHCSPECNARAPLKITVAVVSAAELQQGVAISEQDQSWVVHLKSGQPFVVTLKNSPGGPASAKLTSANPAIVAPDQAAMASADGIQGQFRAGAPGRAGLHANGPDCPSGSARQALPWLHDSDVRLGVRTRTSRSRGGTTPAGR